MQWVFRGGNQEWLHPGRDGHVILEEPRGIVVKWVAGPIPAQESGGAGAAEVQTGWAWGDQDAMGDRCTRGHKRSRETRGIDGGVRGTVQAGRRRSHSIQVGSLSGSGRCYEGVEESLPTTVLFAINRVGISAGPGNEEARVKKLILGRRFGEGCREF